MSELRFDPIGDGGLEVLAEWLAGDEWPLHRVVRPTVDQARQWVRDGRFDGVDNRAFWIWHKRATEPIGLLALHELSEPTPVFDLRLVEAWRFAGHGCEALSWLAEYLFSEVSKHRIEGHTRADNAPMRRVFRKCGWVKEGYHRQAWPDSTGLFHDAVTYALLRVDWVGGRTTEVPWNDEP